MSQQCNSGDDRFAAPIRRAATHTNSKETTCNSGILETMREIYHWHGQRAPIVGDALIVNRTLVTLKIICPNGFVQCNIHEDGLNSFTCNCNAGYTALTSDQRVALFSTHVLRMAFKDRKA